MCLGLAQLVELLTVNEKVRGSSPLSQVLQRKCMSVKYEKFLQEQITSIDLEVSQLKGLVKALLNAAREVNERLEELDNRIPIETKDSHDRF
jgi:hypothetical protein